MRRGVSPIPRSSVGLSHLPPNQLRHVFGLGLRWSHGVNLDFDILGGWALLPGSRSKAVLQDCYQTRSTGARVCFLSQSRFAHALRAVTLRSSRWQCEASVCLYFCGTASGLRIGIGTRFRREHGHGPLEVCKSP